MGPCVLHANRREGWWSLHQDNHLLTQLLLHRIQMCLIYLCLWKAKQWALVLFLQSEVPCTQWEMSVDWVVSPVIFPPRVGCPPTVSTLSKWKWVFCRLIPPSNDPVTELLKPREETWQH
jgi:hypothetical protein